MRRIMTAACVAGLTLAIGAPAFAGAISLATTRVANGVAYPTFVTHAPGDPDRLFILQKTGQIKILDLTTNTILPTNFLNVSVTGGTSLNDERGLLGLAFHPDYETNGFFYINYTGSGGATTIRRYKVSGDPNIADASSGVTILTISQPFTNHNGGWIGFKPGTDHLYIGTGDGGSANDPGNRAQDITSQLLGKMLRIIPSTSEPASPTYTIPSDNPFVGVTGDDEIWGYGLRNPWRCSFDRQTGDLYIGDVGQNAWEEIDVVASDSPGGLNFGWRCMEGNNCTGLSGCTCNDNALTDPAYAYSHSNGFSVTGGYVYRGCAIPEIDGFYFFGDYVLQRLWTGRWNGSILSGVQLITTQLSPSIEGFTVNQISAFGEDANGEIYICDHGGSTTGQIFKIIPSSGEVDCDKAPCVGDLTGDGIVGAEDLASLLANWGPQPKGNDADLDGDGDVGPADLAIMLGAWGDCP
ncbi:MAG: PQQ-dependent sugar dehydrogenase [Phycisphaerales bacterium]|nr:PQQ-dependent sugar dehydrogenase [Phycisphaerales bacterium]